MFRMSAKVTQVLTHDAFVLVANALVSNWLDYSNSLFRSFSKFNFCKIIVHPKILV